MNEEFPSATFYLILVNLLVFAFTFKDINFYISSFGFIPSIFRMYSLLTYMFIHADIIQLLFNAIILFFLGFILENLLKKSYFLLIYVFSGFVSALFDGMGRILLGIPLDLPLIGSSGAVFGLVAVAALIRPFERIPTFMVLPAIIPFFFLSWEFGILLNPMFVALLVVVFCMLFLYAFVFKPTIPVFYSFFLCAVFWFFSILAGFKESISYFGHIGGVLGGVFTFLLIFLVRRRHFLRR